MHSIVCNIKNTRIRLVFDIKPPRNRKTMQPKCKCDISKFQYGFSSCSIIDLKISCVNEMNRWIDIVFYMTQISNPFRIHFLSMVQHVKRVLFRLIYMILFKEFHINSSFLRYIVRHMYKVCRLLHSMITCIFAGVFQFSVSYDFLLLHGDVNINIK